MPIAPAHPCSQSGCPVLVPHGAGSRCPEHAPAPFTGFAPRASARSRGYDARWDRARRYHLAQHPTCAHCGAPATDVDHITPFHGIGDMIDNDLRLDPDNLQSLCRSCHSRKTGREAAALRTAKSKDGQ